MVDVSDKPETERQAVAEGRVIMAPKTLEHRYLLEDVPTGLIPLLELGRAAGLASPTLAGLVERGRAALGGKLWRGERTLAALGLAGRSVGSVRTFVERGLAAAPKRPVPAFERQGMDFELVSQF